MADQPIRGLSKLGQEVLNCCGHSQRQGRDSRPPSVAQGRVYLLGTKGQRANLIALDEATGALKWRLGIGNIFRDSYGNGPRGTPTVDATVGGIYCITGGGNLICTRTDGRTVWYKSLTSDFGGRVPQWGYSESPLVHEGLVLATPGGSKTIVALDKRTGELKWSANLNERAAYTSLMPTASGFAGITASNMVGISKNGAILWKYGGASNHRGINCTTPIVVGDQVYGCSGYGNGGGLVSAGQEVYTNRAIKNHHGGIVFDKGYVFGYSDGAGWVCQKFADGSVVWRDRGFVKGSIAHADNRFYLYSEGGSVALAEATTGGWGIRGRFNIPNKSGRSTWPHPVIANGKLYIRDQNNLWCYEVKR